MNFLYNLQERTEQGKVERGRCTRRDFERCRDAVREEGRRQECDSAGQARAHQSRSPILLFFEIVYCLELTDLPLRYRQID